MTRNFKLIIEYDGSRYHGWQRQKEDRSIQGEIEKALKIITAGSVTLIGSGRTDAGVHAQGQVANFKCDTRLEPDALMNGLNSLLEDDIVIKVCEPVSISFHARYDARSKVYHYRILNRPLPAAIGRQYSWFIRKALNHDAMRAPPLTSSSAAMISNHLRAPAAPDSIRPVTFIQPNLPSKTAGCGSFRSKPTDF